MPNIPGFLSPREDITIRGVHPDKAEAIMNAVVDIIGGRVEFSVTAIYENEYTMRHELPIQQCNSAYRHPRHKWFYQRNDLAQCPGLEIVEPRTRFG